MKFPGTDSRKKYVAVKSTSGDVEHDADWNRPGGRKSRRGSSSAVRIVILLVIAALALSLALGLALTALGYGPVAGALEARRLPSLVVSLVYPGDGDVVPLHGTLWVRGDVVGRSPAQDMTLIVNGQIWGTTPLTPLERSASWGWTPSGEGRHELQVVARDEAGRNFSSATVSVFASAQADFRVPYQHTVLEGETLADLGPNYGSSTDEILDANPGLDPGAPLGPGDVVTIPMHIPTGPVSSPQNGSPAPPAGPLPEGPPSIPPQGDGTPFGEAVAAMHTIPVPPGFTITNGVLVPSQAIDKLYLYLSVDGGEWHRVPKNPQEFIPAAFGAFHLKPYIDFAALDKLPEPVLLKAEGWGWAGGTLVSLGSYSGYYGAGQLHWPYGGTDLQVFSHQTLGKKYYATQANLSGDDPSRQLEFRWASQTVGVTGAVWQASEKPFSNTVAFNPPGLIQYGLENGNSGRFTIDFADYFKGKGGSDFWGDLFGGVFDVIGGPIKSPPTKQFWGWTSRTFFVRVIPLGANPAAAPSNTVVVFFTPSGKPVPISGPLTGPVYEARIVGFDPFLPPDPDYGACWVTNFEQRDCRNVFGYGGMESLQWSAISEADVANGRLTEEQYQQCQVRIPKGMPTCGCPGASCSSSSSSCSLSPTDWGTCLEKGAQAVGSVLAKGWDALAGVYNQTVSFIKKMVAELNPFCIAAKKAAAEYGGETVTEEEVAGVCQSVADIAVTAVMTYFGLPPSLPEFDKLLDEGLDYAIGVAASEMGIDCNKACRDLLKDGFQAVTSGENLIDRGLELGASRAAEELRDLGVDCNAQCEKLIHDGAQGKASLGQVSEIAVNQATQEIVSKLNANGIPCDSECADAIRDQLEQGAAIGNLAANAAASKPYEPPMIPHPRAAEQPAIVRVEIFRRWESADVPRADLERCGLSLDNLVTNAVTGPSLSGRLFEPIGVDIPVLDPGETMTIPVLLERGAVPQPVLSAMNPSGKHVTLPGLGDVTELAAWFNFYSKGQITVRTWGPLFISSASDKPIPCVDEVSSIYNLPDIGFTVTFP